MQFGCVSSVEGPVDRMENVISVARRNTLLPYHSATDKPGGHFCRRFSDFDGRQDCPADPGSIDSRVKTRGNPGDQRRYSQPQKFLLSSNPEVIERVPGAEINVFSTILWMPASSCWSRKRGAGAIWTIELNLFRENAYNLETRHPQPDRHGADEPEPANRCPKWSPDVT